MTAEQQKIRVLAMCAEAIDEAKNLAQEEEDRGEDFVPDFGGNQDDAYSAGERDGQIRGAAALAKLLVTVLA